MNTTQLHSKPVKAILSAVSKAKAKNGTVLVWSTSLLLSIGDVIVIQNYQIGVHNGDLLAVDIEKTHETKELHFKEAHEQEIELFQKCREILAVTPSESVEAYRDGLDIFYPSEIESKFVKKVITMFDKRQMIQAWSTESGLLCLRNKSVSLLTTLAD